MRQKAMLVKPLTYMNASGQAVGPSPSTHQVAPQDILVVHDDLDLASGMLRLRQRQRRGQNGVKVIQHLGSQDFHRACIGVGRPPAAGLADYVLQNFSDGEEDTFELLRAIVADALECWFSKASMRP